MSITTFITASALFMTGLGEQNYLAVSADTSVKPVTKKSDYTFRDGFAGIHYTSQHALRPALKDSNRFNAGFNMQLMSRNLLPASPFGGYLGLDWGMQFYGKGQQNQCAAEYQQRRQRLDKAQHLQHGLFCPRPHRICPIQVDSVYEFLRRAPVLQH